MKKEKIKDKIKLVNKNYTIKTIAIIDIILGLILTYMSYVSLVGLYNLYNNPQIASQVFNSTGGNLTELTFVAIMFCLINILTFIFAIGMLKNIKWAIIGRLALAGILSIWILYNILTGESNWGNVLFYYELIVLFLLEVQLRK